MAVDSAPSTPRSAIRTPPSYLLILLAMLAPVSVLAGLMVGSVELTAAQVLGAFTHDDASLASRVI